MTCFLALHQLLPTSISPCQGKSMFHRLDQTLVNKLFENQSVFIQVLPINTCCGLLWLLTPLHFSVDISLSIPKAEW